MTTTLMAVTWVMESSVKTMASSWNGTPTLHLLATGAVPEPSEWAAMGLFGTGLLGLVVRGRKKKLAN